MTDAESVAHHAHRTPGNLTSWRRQLVVEPLWEMLCGARVLRVRGYRDADPRTTFERVEVSRETESG